MLHGLQFLELFCRRAYGAGGGDAIGTSIDRMQLLQQHMLPPKLVA